MHITIKNKNLIYKDYRIKCAVGKRGIGIKKKEGDLITPKGDYKIKFILYRKDRVKNLKTNIKKIVINKKHGWCDDPKSKKYNKLIKYPFNCSSEKMYRKDNIYDIIGVLNFNMNPIRKNKGSAIFIHVATKYFKHTKGCVAIRKDKLIKLIQDFKRNTKIRIV
jgi:L,D-peptidoglycan transpeptidase YkuD (ErfK/YbiS/YcfS/YnhG family)